MYAGAQVCLEWYCIGVHVQHSPQVSAQTCPISCVHRQAKSRERRSHPFTEPDSEGACWHAGKLIRVDAHRVTVGGKQTYGCVNMSDFLNQLAAKLEPNPTSLKNFRRMYTPKGLHEVDPKGPLETSVLYDRVQVTGSLPVHCALVRGHMYGVVLKLNSANTDSGSLWAQKHI